MKLLDDKAAATVPSLVEGNNPDFSQLTDQCNVLVKDIIGKDSYHLHSFFYKHLMKGLRAQLLSVTGIFEASSCLVVA